MQYKDLETHSNMIYFLVSVSWNFVHFENSTGSNAEDELIIPENVQCDRFFGISASLYACAIIWLVL